MASLQNKRKQAKSRKKYWKTSTPNVKKLHKVLDVVLGKSMTLKIMRKRNEPRLRRDLESTIQRNC